MYEIHGNKVVLPVYHGALGQRGEGGLGNILGSIAKFVAPVIRSAGKAVY